jgi:hypothetical protein
MTNKTLFDAVEAELRNARTAINSAGTYMDMIKDTVDRLEKSTGMEAPLSLSSGKPFADSMVKTESERYEKLDTVSKRLKEHSNLL